MTGFPRRISAVSPRVWILLGLVALTFGIYGQTAWHPFISLDDEVLVYGNPHVRIGLTWENIRWAFTSISGDSFWHPLTWLSFMLDVELFGMNAGGHHLMSVGIHALNAMLLFLVLARMTGCAWRSAFVAALFAVHPLHVESVAWVAERKDVLSALFFLLSLWAYSRYAERPGVGRYGLVALCFALSLMSKSMGVTLPFVLLLLDYWPLRRIEGITPVGEDSAGKCPHVTWKRTLLEKVPLLLMSAVSAALTLSYGRDSTWVTPLGALTIGFRVANAAVSYVAYLGKTGWPSSLAVFYPHPAGAHEAIPLWKATGAIVLLAGISFLIIREARRRPFLLVGWFWYLGTLVPVIGLVQVGSQAMADRYTYIPLIGVFIAVAWGIPELLGGWRFRRTVLKVAGIASIIAFAAIAWVQTGYWRDSITLISHSNSVTENNWFLLNELGKAYAESGRLDEAIPYYQKAVRILPEYNDAWLNLGTAFMQLGEFREAIPCYLQVLRSQPDLVEIWNNIGVALSKLGQPEAAIGYYRQALRFKPDYYDAWFNLGLAYKNIGQPQLADQSLREAERHKRSPATR